MISPILVVPGLDSEVGCCWEDCSDGLLPPASEASDAPGEEVEDQVVLMWQALAVLQAAGQVAAD